MPEFKTAEMLSDEMHNTLNAVSGLATSLSQLRLMMHNELRKGGVLSIEQMGTIVGHCESPVEIMNIFEEAFTWFTTVTAILGVGYSEEKMTISNVRDRVSMFHQRVLDKEGEPVFGLIRGSDDLLEEDVKTFNENLKAGVNKVNSLITA